MLSQNAEVNSVSKTATPSLYKNKSSIGEILKNWASRNRWYLMAFFIPIILMYISYAIFGLYPFGEESVLALDFNAQYVYYFEALRDAFWGDGSIFYSWGRNLSGGYMGVIGYYLASPFTLIVMLLPEKMMLTSLLLMILAKIGSASTIFCLYLQKSKKLQPMPAFMFGILYSLMAYMVIQTIDPMWLDGVVFLPLVALGVEYLIDDGRKINYIIPLAIMFVANFYIGYMIGIFTAFYFIYYLFFGTELRNRKAKDYFYSCLTFGVSTIVAVMCSAFMILPVYKALSLGKFDFSGKPDYSFKTQFDPIIIFRQLLTCQYDSVNVQGSPEIYCGILTVVLLPLFFLSKKITGKKKIGYGFLLTVMFFSMYIKPVDMWWHGGQVPNWLPFRYSFIISFILLSMAGSVFKELEHIDVTHFGGIFFGIMALVLFINTQQYEHLDEMKSIWLSIGLAGVYLLILYGMCQKKTKYALPVLLMCVISGELIFNTVETMKAVDKEVAYSTRASYRTFVRSGRETVALMNELDGGSDADGGLFRSEKTFTRCINDNLAFGLKGITHSSSVMNTLTLKFIETLGYNMRSYYSRYDGTTELADSLLGIKYVLDRGDDSPRSLLHPSYEHVTDYNYQDYDDKNSDGTPKDKTISIYKNPNALSIGYMVNEDLLKIDHLGNDDPFNSQNVLMSSMMGKTIFDEAGQIAGTEAYYTPIDIEDPVLGAVTLSDYNGQACYTKMDSGDPTVDYCFTVTENKRVYAYLRTENEMAVNLWLGTYNEETGNYEFDSRGFGTYFETKNYCILDLGVYEIGTKVALRLTVNNDNNATIIKAPHFYYFNEDVYQNDIDVLKTKQLTIQKHTDTYIRGTVTAEEGEVLFTSIPFEDGWTVKVDGKKVETTQCLKAMIYVPLTAGTHTVTLSYLPPYFELSIVLFIIGIGVIIMFYRYDRKNNKILIARIRNKKREAMKNA
ncbi:MAG: YfhO family protein [Oscillospiraceae bacterium]|nr:YfhO family protein [Oscillospiraceae bacterium]